MPAAKAPVRLAPLKRAEPLPDRIYRSVHEKIASGALDPTTRLTETRLAHLLGVSRTPVREALARLRREGLLAPTPRGAVMAALTRADLEEIMELRLLIEPFVAARAAERATPQDVAALEAALAQEVQALPARSPQAFAMANHRFRLALMQAAGNGRLAETASRYDAQIQALRRATLASRENRDIVVREHRRLVKAVRAGDRHEAEAAMRALMGEAQAFMLAQATPEAGASRG